MKKRFFLIMLSALFIFTGCSAKTTQDSEASAETITDTTTAKADETTVTTTAKPTLVLPETQNTSGKVQIQTVSTDSYYSFNSYIITSTKGESVVVDPTQMPTKKRIDLNPAAIVCTHDHPDHTDSTFTDSYDCQKILYTKSDIKTRDFHIYTILSSHSDDVIDASNKNVIIVFEVDGLRIAHMGDIGETKLTDEQLKDLGHIDIAFMQFENSYSDMSLENEKGFKLIEQLNPSVVIPTHYTDAAFPVIEKKYSKITEYNNILDISKEDLPQKPLTFYHILNTHKYY